MSMTQGITGTYIHELTQVNHIGESISSSGF